MFIANYSRTMAGAAKRAAQRVEALPSAIPAREQGSAPQPAPEPSNVVRMVIPRSPAQQIIADVAHQHGLTYADLIGKSRSRRFIPARFDAIAAVKTANPALSLPQIGKLFNRDFSTIAHALRQRGWK